MSLNTAMDRTMLVPGLQPGRSHRAQNVHVRLGGKGGNVARAARQLGEPVRLLGFVGGTIGLFLRGECARLGIDDRLTETAQETRVCAIYVDPSGGATVVNEPGPTIAPAELQAFLATYDAALATASVVVLSGSLPAGVPVTFYRELINRAHAAGVRPLLDTSGAALREGLAARPWAIKPNDEELAELVGSELHSEADLQAHCQRLAEQGIPNVIVSRGGEGALVWSAGQCWRVRPPRIQVVSPIGCGDAFVAGLAVSAHRQASILDGARLGTAAAAANAAHLEPDVPPLADLAPFLTGVEITAC